LLATKLVAAPFGRLGNLPGFLAGVFVEGLEFVAINLRAAPKFALESPHPYHSPSPKKRK
jgi:hypothetical protein